MKNYILIALTIFSLNSFAELANPKLKNVQFDVKGIGHVKIKYDEPGEPVVQPERLQIFITCNNSKRAYRFKVFRFCNWENYSYDPEARVLSLKLISGRIDMNTGEVNCDQFDEAQVDMSTACK